MYFWRILWADALLLAGCQWCCRFAIPIAADCPNSCNGHGMCRSNRQFAEKYARAMSTATNLNYFLPKCTDDAGAEQYKEENCARNIEHLDNYFSTYMATYDDAWDSNLQWGCDCDGGFFGPDCSLRECPSNVDPLDNLCEGLLTDVDNLKVHDSVGGADIILSTTDEDETAQTFGSAYADYLAQFTRTNILQSDTGSELLRHLTCLQYQAAQQCESPPIIQKQMCNVLIVLMYGLWVL